MKEAVSVEEVINRPEVVLIDVRTNSEHQKGTIPGAINLSLFDEEERGEIGILYRMVGPAEARIKGLALASSKLTRLVESLQKYYHREIVFFCWRGGLRSQALASVLKLVGFKSYYLEGGYKAYRRFIINYFSEYEYKQKFTVLEGLTGVGKTEVIQALQRIGEPALDLENLAGHRGSVFGHIGLATRRSQKDFDALLAQELEHLKDYKYIIVECESRRIGNIYLPAPFFEAMKKGVRILLYDCLEARIKRLVATYLAFKQENFFLIHEAISLLQPRLGKQKTALLQNFFKQENYKAAVNFLLQEYYDPLYHFPACPDKNYPLSVWSGEPEKAALEIKDYLKKIT